MVLVVQGKKITLLKPIVTYQLNLFLSMDGLFLENGPFRANKDLTLSVNPGGWQNYATNIYGLYLNPFLRNNKIN